MGEVTLALYKCQMLTSALIERCFGPFILAVFCVNAELEDQILDNK